MALNIKDGETERLAREVAALTGESKTRAVREALRERKQRLLIERGGSRSERVAAVIERRVPRRHRGAPRKADEEQILGFGPEGV